MSINPDYKFFSTITPTQHEKDEWSRLATAAYSSGRNSIGHSFSVAASLPREGQIRLAYFDALQASYRAWLVSGEFVAVEG